MLKIAVSLVAGVILPFWIYIVPVWLLPSLKERRSDASVRMNSLIEKDGGMIAQIKKIGPITIGFLLICFSIFDDQHVAHFQIAPINKFIEDCMCSIVFVTILCFVGYTSSWVSYGLKQIKFPIKQ
jgi:hypothetical protein